MSLFTSRMRLVSAVVLDDKSEPVTAELLKIGLLDFVEISNIFDIDDFNLRETETSKSAEINELRLRLDTLYRQAGIETPHRAPLSVDQMTELNPEEARKTIDGLRAGIENIRDKLKKLHQEKLKLDEIGNYLSQTEDSTSSDKSFLSVNRGSPGRSSFDEMLKQLSAVPHFGTEIPESGDCIIVSLKRDHSLVNEILTRFSWTEKDLQHRRQSETELISKNISVKSNDLNQEIERTRSEISEHITDNKSLLDVLWKNIRLHELYANIQNHFSHTEKTSLFSGWLPAEKSQQAEKAIRKASGNNCIIEWSEPENFVREAVPVEIKQPKVFSPFKMLVENYAVPEYGTIDPTLFVAAAYLVMFGLMFGDAGQGAVIALIGLFGGKLIKNASDGIRNLFKLFIYCGTASVISGILFGSYFGYQLFPPLWFDYHGVVAGHSAVGRGNIHDVYDILRITIYFGIAVIGSGLMINWINLFRKKDYFNLFLDKSGIIGGWFYGCGIYTSFFFVGTAYKELPPANLLTIFFGIPVLILFFKAPLYFILHERGHKNFSLFSIIDFIMEWIVELLEIFSGYLANTLSFMRVAGLGIAHVSLMVAFDTIAGMTSGVAAVLILILGNILVIALEGLSAGIQALRLNYYEFFSRYFTGKGIAYNPVSLRSRKQEG